MGKKRQKAARTTISVPPPLKKRMENVAEHVNWSAVACEAFRAKLDEIESRVQITTTAQLIDRLKQQSDTGTTGVDFVKGKAAGTKWALNIATAEQMRLLDEFHREHSAAEWRQLFVDDTGWRAIARLLDPRVARHPRFGKRFWLRILADVEIDHPDVFRGFAEGVIEVWREVKDQL